MRRETGGSRTPAKQAEMTATTTASCRTKHAREVLPPEPMVDEKKRRVEGAQVRLGVIVGALKGRPSHVDHESQENGCGKNGLGPPRVFAGGRSESFGVPAESGSGSRRHKPSQSTSHARNGQAHSSKITPPFRPSLLPAGAPIETRGRASRHRRS